MLPTPKTEETRDDFLSRGLECEKLARDFPSVLERRSVLSDVFASHKSSGPGQKERKIVSFEVKEIDVARGTFKGYGSTFGNVDHGNDRVIAGAFTGTLKAFKDKNQLPAMFWLHDWKQPVGEWMSMHEDKKGLAVEGALWVAGNALGQAPIEKSEQVRNLLNSNGPKGLSIGYEAEEFEFVTEGEDSKILVRNLKKIGLLEVSPVPYGMNAEATVTAAKCASFSGALPERKRELETALRDVGLSHRDAKRLISGGWSALVGDDDADLAKALMDLRTTIGG